LAIRTEIDDLEQQHVDLAHLAVAALRSSQLDNAAAIARFLAASPGTAKGMYRHDRHALAAVLAATADRGTLASASFTEARQLVSQIEFEVP
jgi:hypothetical protein